MAIHSSILTWKFAWKEEPGGLQSMGVAESNMTELGATAAHCKEKAFLASISYWCSTRSPCEKDKCNCIFKDRL